MSMTNPETGEVTTVTKHSDGSNNVTIKDSAGNIVSEGTPGTGALPPDTIGAVRDDPVTGQRFVSIESDDQAISSTESFDPTTGLTTITQILDPSIEGGRAQYVINPDGTQDSLVGLPEDGASAYSVDPKTGKKHVSVERTDGTRDSYVIDPDGTPDVDSFDTTPDARNPLDPGANIGRDIGFGSQEVVVEYTQDGHVD